MPVYIATIELNSNSESPDFMALYKLVFNFNFNRTELKCVCFSSFSSVAGVKRRQSRLMRVSQQRTGAATIQFTCTY